jgi:hypothetical protein
MQEQIKNTWNMRRYTVKDDGYDPGRVYTHWLLKATRQFCPTENQVTVWHEGWNTLASIQRFEEDKTSSQPQLWIKLLYHRWDPSLPLIALDVDATGLTWSSNAHSIFIHDWRLIDACAQAAQDDILLRLRQCDALSILPDPLKKFVAAYISCVPSE